MTSQNNGNFSQVPYLQSGLPQDENRSPATGFEAPSYDGQLGARFVFVDPEDGLAKAWQLVQQDSAVDVAASAGAVAWWRDATGYVVTTDVSVAGRGHVAGIYAGLIDVNNIGCVQQGGRAAVQFSAGTPDATGLIVIPTATDAKAEALAAGTAATYPPIGVTLGTATDNVAYVELQLPGRL